MTELMAAGALLLALGLICLMVRRTLIGALVGIQLLTLGASMNFVLSGIAADARQHGHIFALVIVLAGVAALSAGYAIAVRMFYLRERVEMEELRTLRG